MIARRLAGLAWMLAGVCYVLGFVNYAVMVVDLITPFHIAAFLAAVAPILLALSPQTILFRILLVVWGLALAAYQASYIAYAIPGLSLAAAPVVAIAGLGVALTAFVPRVAHGAVLWVVPVLGVLSALTTYGYLLSIGEGGLVIVAVLTALICLIGGIFVLAGRSRTA